jgi:hypothetical protein
MQNVKVQGEMVCLTWEQILPYANSVRLAPMFIYLNGGVYRNCLKRYRLGLDVPT